MHVWIVAKSKYLLFNPIRDKATTHQCRFLTKMTFLCYEQNKNIKFRILKADIYFTFVLRTDIFMAFAITNKTRSYICSLYSQTKRKQFNTFNTLIFFLTIDYLILINSNTIVWQYINRYGIKLK